MKNKRLFLFVALMIAVLPLAVFGGGSQDTKAYPNRNITVLIPRGAGGPTDITTRNLIEFLRPQLPRGVNLIPLNKPEGTGIAAMAEGASAKTDGYTLTVVVVEASILPHMGIMKNTVDDYRGITVTSGEPMGLVVRPDAPYKTLDELVAYAKAHPGEITMGNVGAGSAVHLAALDFEKNCGIKFMHVPYNDGTGPMIAAMVGGHLDAGFSTVVAAVPQAAAGGIRALGIMDTKRSEYWPDVPTFKEKFGIDFSHLAWAALCAPKDTPDNIINYLIDICKSAMETDEFKKQVKTLGVTPVTYYGADVDKMMRSDSDVYGPIIKELGL